MGGLVGGDHSQSDGQQGLSAARSTGEPVPGQLGAQQPGAHFGCPGWRPSVETAPPALKCSQAGAGQRGILRPAIVTSPSDLAIHQEGEPGLCRHGFVFPSSRGHAGLGVPTGDKALS